MSGNSDPKIKRPKLQQKLSQFFTKSDLGDKSEILSTNAQPLDSGSDHEYDNADIEVEKVEVETRSDNISTSDSDDNNDTSDDEVGRPSESDAKVERIESIQSSIETIHLAGHWSSIITFRRPILGWNVIMVYLGVQNAEMRHRLEFLPPKTNILVKSGLLVK